MARAKRSGRYKYQSIKGNTEKELFAKDYYKKHKKAIDKAIDLYRNSKNRPINKTNEEIFVSYMKYGRDFGSAQQAKKAAERLTVELAGGDTDWYDAKHGANKKIFGDLRKLNKFKPTYIDYDFEYAGDQYTDKYAVTGYYDTTDPNIKIASKTIFPTDDSPYTIWEYVKASEIGL